MKKHLAAWLVLGLITVAAGLSLSVTNEVTKEPIHNQAVLAEAKAKQEVLPEAEAFDPVELAEDAGMELFAGKAGDQVVGYVGKVIVNGYGGPIDVIAGVNADGMVKGINVGGPSFSETAGLGAKSREKAFTDQFVNKLSPIRVIKASDPKTDSSVDAITAATITSNAVVGGVNRIAKQIDAILNPSTDEPVITAEGTTYTASQQGFAGPVAVFVTVKDDGTISQLKVGDDKFAESEGYGAGALEDIFTNQFVGKQLPLSKDDIEAISGATITTTAVLNAINQAFEEKNAVGPAAPEGKPYTASQQGFGGPVSVTATITNEGTISHLVIGDDSFNETEGYGAGALEPEFIKQFVGKQLPLSKDDIEAISGATITTNAVLEAINQAYEQSKADAGEVTEPTAVPETEEPEPAQPETDLADMKTATKQGFEGPVTVKVAVNEDGSIKKLVVGDDQFKETPGLGARAQEPEFATQFVGKTAPLTIRKADEEETSSTIDAIAGATVTSQAVVDAVNEALADATSPATEEPVEKMKTAVKQGFEGPVAVKVAVNEDGSIKSLLIGDDQFKETPGLGARAQEPEFAAQFVGKVAPLTIRKADEEETSSTIDAIAGATVTSQAVVDAVNEALADATAPLAEEPVEDDMKGAVKQGFEGPVAVKVAVNEDGSIKSLVVGDDQFKETPGLGARAQEPEFAAQFVGKVAPLTIRKADEEETSSTIDALTGATVTSQAVVDAVNEALTDATAPVTEEPVEDDMKAAVKQGFEGPVAVNVTVKEDGSITGLVIGDDQFKETPGLGARAQEPEFISQFIGKVPPLSIRKADEEETSSTIDALTGATVTSQAVVDAINEALAGASEEAITTEKQGVEGPVAVKVVFGKDGSIKSLVIGDDQFKETPGLGARAMEPDFADQFIGKIAPLSIRKADDAEGPSTIDALTGATVTSQAVVDAINDAFEQFKKQ